jgi:hypothetical protein
MSAHWYWDWDWSNPPTTQPSQNAERDKKITANAGGQPRPDDNTKKPTHYSGDQAPFPFPSVKPCQKVQVFFGTKEMVEPSAGGSDYPPHYPPDVNWNHFSQQEQWEYDIGIFKAAGGVGSPPTNLTFSGGSISGGNLSSNTPYYYCVTTTYADGVSVVAEDHYTTGPSDNQITVGWKAPLSGPVPSGYDVYRGIAPGQERFLVHVGSGTLSYPDNGAPLTPSDLPPKANPQLWYWVGCEPTGHCNCQFYSVRAKLPIQRRVGKNGAKVDIYIDDFKCRCVPL